MTSRAPSNAMASANAYSALGPPDAVAAPRDGQFPARQDEMRPLRHQRAGGVLTGNVPRLALDRVAENVDGISRGIASAAAA
jgi:hypothetical protein